MRPARLAATMLAALAFAVVGCGDEESPDGVPDGAVAVVGDVEIGEDDLEREVAAIQRANPASPERDEQREDLTPRQLRAQAETQALAVLLRRQALEQEASARGIAVDDGELRRRWERLSGRQFDSRDQLDTFLAGMTVDDVVDQLRVQELAERIQAKVRARAGGGAAGEGAVARFEERFQAGWAKRSACADPYEVPGC